MSQQSYRLNKLAQNSNVSFEELRNLVTQPGVQATGGGTGYDPTQKFKMETRFAGDGTPYNARFDSPLIPGHSNASSKRKDTLDAKNWQNKIDSAIDNQGESFNPGYIRPQMNEFMDSEPYPQEELDAVALDREKAQYESYRQEGLRNYRQNYQYAPKPSFNESLQAFLLSQGVNDERAQYEVNRQEGLRRFKNLQLKK
jgi:hypothetical protein